VSSVIAGASNAEQVRANATAPVPLSAELLHRLDGATA
jgi:aryl-alcohol dehydrogenase-like predicted oxidoreductase